MLASVTMAFWFTDSIRLWRFASFLPEQNSLSTKHRYKKLVRFLDSINFDLSFWKNYIKFLFSLPYFRLKQRKYISIVIDFTTLKDDFLVLLATVSFRGRGIPIYLKLWKDPNKKYDFWGRVENFLRDLFEILPKRFRYEIIADRGFQGDKFLEICLEFGFDYIVRINGNYIVHVGDEKYVQLCMFSPGVYYDLYIGRNSSVKSNLVVNEIEGEGKERLRWYLRTNLRDRERVVRDYQRRMWIEEGVKDLKSYLRWESYTEKIPEKGRLEKMVVISILSYVIGLCIGSREESIEGIEEDKKREEGLYRRFINIVRASIDRASRFILTVIVLTIQKYYMLWKIFP